MLLPGGDPMRTLVVGIGALGGLIAARLRAAGSPVWLATRNAESAAKLKESGLQARGVGGAVSVEVPEVAPVEEYHTQGKFDLIVLATKAYDAIEVSPNLSGLLESDGTLLPIQNGGVPQMLADRLGDCVLGGLSNLGATMETLGVYEQRNAGHLLIGELAGGGSERVNRVREWLGRAVEVRVTENLRGAVWSKLLLNCSVTTIGAIAGQTMRDYMSLSDGRELFTRSYDEALSVALASGARLERMIVHPVPPGWCGRSIPSETHEAWLGQILKGYGDVKPSMLQDIERGRITEIDFINGYVVDVARKAGIRAPVNATIVATVHAITRKQFSPDPALLGRILHTSY
jgi:2-dehydropantoate 2-reductase